MAKLKTPPFVTELRDGLVKGLAEVGIKAEADFEPLPHTKLFRFYVVAKKFDSMWHSERQELVWRIAEKVVPAEKQLCISMILTLTPEEAGYDRVRRRSRPAPKKVNSARVR